MSISAYEIVGLGKFGEEKIVVGICFIESVSGRLLDISPSAFMDEGWKGEELEVAEHFIEWMETQPDRIRLRSASEVDITLALVAFFEGYRGVECPECPSTNVRDVLPRGNWTSVCTSCGWEG